VDIFSIYLLGIAVFSVMGITLWIISEWVGRERKIAGVVHGWRKHKKENHHGFHVVKPVLDTSLANQRMTVRTREPVMVCMTPMGKYLDNPLCPGGGRVRDTLERIERGDVYEHFDGGRTPPTPYIRPPTPMRYDMQGDRRVGWQFDPSKRSLTAYRRGALLQHKRICYTTCAETTW
jgi:hypothetical protein